MRAAHVFLFLAVFSAFAFSLSLSTDKTAYLKGESILITGADATGPVEIAISSGPREIYRETVPSAGAFTAHYSITGLDPKGVWEISASSGESNKSVSASVSPTREGAFYLPKFTSPPYEGTEYSRTDTVLLSLSVLDSGKPVSKATVRAFVGAKEFFLAETSPGIYQADYALPFDSKIGPTEIYIVAEKNESGKSFGGENAIKIEVKGVPIQIDFLSPGAGTYKLGETITIKARITYSTGAVVKNPIITARANELAVSLSDDGSGVYTGEYKTRENDSGVIMFSLLAADSAGNKGSAYRNVEVKGIAAQAVTDYYWYLVVGGALILIIAALAIKFLLARTSLEKLENEREEIIAMEKGLQEDYIKKGTIDRETFQKRMSSYEAKLTDLDEKIKRKKGTK